MAGDGSVGAGAAGVSPRDVARVLADPARRAALHASGLLDSPPEEAFDRLTRLAARLIGVPTAVVSLVDTDRQFFKSGVGLDEPWASARATPLSHSFCQHVVAAAAPLIIADARDHPLVCDNLAIPDLGVVAYAGMPLTTPDGHALGSFCAIDTQPRAWTDDELATLADLAAAATTEIALRAAMRDLAAERDFARQITETMGQGLAITDGAGDFTYVNPAYAALLGYAPDELIGATPFAVTDPADHAELRAVQAARRAGRASSYETRLRRRDGGAVHALITGVPHPSGIGAIAVVADLTERHRMEEALREAHQRLTHHVENSPIAAIECAPDLTILRWSPGAERTFGWSAEEVVGRRANTDFAIMLPDELPTVGQIVGRLLDGRDERNVYYNRNLTKDGRVIRCEWHNSVLRDRQGAVVSIFSLALDVTAQALMQEQLAHQALHDPLTGLPNRASLAGRFRDLIARDRRHAVLFLDLDGFKGVNDTHGHAVGDELLTVIARRLERVVRGGDSIARLGGDEFVVIADGVRGTDDALALARRLTAAIERPIALAGERIRVGASIGIAISTPDLRDPEALLLAADAAMYRAKRGGDGPCLADLSAPPDRGEAREEELLPLAAAGSAR